ncbi:MAG: RAMP superfamily CRISPR-associated protein [Reinekea sp.]
MSKRQLARNAIKEQIENSKSIHPGLLLQKGLPEIENNDQDESKQTDSNSPHCKTDHIKKICTLPITEGYKKAFDRWFDLTADSERFQHCILKLENRLFIGLSGTGALETGCALNHCYGMPYIPGSTVKGVVLSWAEKHLPIDKQAIIQQLLGTPKTDELPDLAGLVNFYDAWWVPINNTGPFIQEVVTSHHQEYYGNSGKTAATDLDSPIPNALIAVQGSFLFVLSGRADYCEKIIEILNRALSDIGVGAKTAAGYGYMVSDKAQLQQLESESKNRKNSLDYIRATITLNPGSGAITATVIMEGKPITTAPIRGDDAKKLIAKIPENERKGKKIKSGNLPAMARVFENGNKFELLDIKIE